VIADSFEQASVMFADIIGFTEFSAALSPQSLVKSLNLLFSCYDSLADRYGIEKIKTVGDAYMAASGIPIPRDDHAEAMIEMALEMIEETERMKSRLVRPFQIRVGICSGPVVAGVIGHRKFCYDLWGDTVNTASRMSSIGNHPHVRLTESTYELVTSKYTVSEPETLEVKGKGKMRTYMLTGRITP
jgi:adenylate cyclase